MGTKEYRLSFRGDIEGLRAVAIVLVVAAHAGVPWLAGGFVGVDVFFVLSGYLITGLLMQEVAQSGRLGFATFYVRRLRRLLPALLVMLLVVCLLASQLLIPEQQRRQASAAAMAAVWLSNIHFALDKLDYFTAGAESNLFLHTWSLGVEEQFYLIWPALLWIVWSLANKSEQGFHRYLKVVLSGVVAVSLIASLVSTALAPQWAFYMMPMRAWQFAVGGLVWLLPRSSASAWISGRAALSLFGALGLALIIGAGLWMNGAVPYPGWRAIAPTLGAAFVVYAGTINGQASVNKGLAWRPLQLLGRISYSWYLWHWPVLLLGRLVIEEDTAVLRASEVLVSLILAALSYRYIESPLRHQERWLTFRRAALLGSLCIMVVANLLAIRWYNHAAEQSVRPETNRYTRAHLDAPIIYSMGCDDWYHSDRVNICAFGPKKAEHTAVLIGDSIVGQWFPAIERVFDRPGWRLLVLTKSSCAMVDESFFYERIGREYSECDRWRTAALVQVADIKPDVILMGGSANYGFTESQWIEGSARVFRAINGSTGNIFVLRATPGLPFDGPYCLAKHQGKIDECSAPYQHEHNDQVFGWLQAAASRFPNVSAVDFNDLVCPKGVCRAMLGERIVFRDTQHMTANFAQSLGDAVTARLAIGVTKSEAVDASHR